MLLHFFRGIFREKNFSRNVQMMGIACALLLVGQVGGMVTQPDEKEVKYSQEDLQAILGTDDGLEKYEKLRKLAYKYVCDGGRVEHITYTQSGNVKLLNDWVKSRNADARQTYVGTYLKRLYALEEYLTKNRISLEDLLEFPYQYKFKSPRLNDYLSPTAFAERISKLKSDKKKLKSAMELLEVGEKTFFNPSSRDIEYLLTPLS